MKKKYLLLCVFAGFLFACSDDSPTVPDKEPEEKPGEGSDDNNKPEPKPEPKPEEGTAYVFPADFTDELVGKEVVVKNDLFVVSTYRDEMSGTVVLAPSVLRTPTDIKKPGSEEYKALALQNKQSKLVLNTSGVSLLDPTLKTLRVGTKVSGLKGKVSKSGEKYELTFTETPTISHAARPSFQSVSGADVSVASMNLEFYMASPSRWGHSNGARNEDEFGRQHDKIMEAMKKLSTDIFAICEIEEGAYSPEYLTAALNKALGTQKYKFVDTGDDKVTANTKNTFIYNSEVVSPFKECKSYSGSYLNLRHIIQCFQMVNGDGKFILSLNHFKAKTGKNASGANADQYDGQGKYNARRVEEAQDCLKSFSELEAYYGDSDVLVVGDLNCYSMEDPIKVFKDAGYTDELMKYSPESWSYIYDGQAGYLDHILSSSSMTSQVVNAVAWDVNASEPSGIGYRFTDFYQADAYRYSDHNPVVAFLNLR